MNKKITKKILLIILVTTCNCLASGCKQNTCSKPTATPELNTVDEVLMRLEQKTDELRSYQCQIEYLFSQPLFESETLRKGLLYYRKSEAESWLRVNFQTLKQDEEKEQKYLEHFIFDGIWLTHINYKIKEVKRYQQAEPNHPVDVFELAQRNFPIIGFSKTENLKKEFEIELVSSKINKTNSLIQLHLKVKPDSTYKNDYVSIDFWIDKKLYLPAKIIAVSIEEDIYQITLLNVKVNKKINEKVFEVNVPKGFGKPEIIPLKDPPQNNNSQKTKQKVK